ncbi:HAAS signaling domain-containing protein [Spirillospora sp. NPDC048911]|uniref:HAAS signaling domain-containing protein n=1 Tax=Spirillospora sp. NPDC048911 TaxID=3364527 RepID=UPI003722A8F0
MNSPIDRQEEIEQYARDVRAALADIPEADRAELLEDLEDHLAEVSAESDEPLVSRLGLPVEYATELRAAYGTGTVRTRRSVRDTAAGTFQSMEARLREKVDDSAALRSGWGFLKEFRSVWWIVRAWVAALLLWRFWDDDWHTRPRGAAQWAVLILFVVASIALGRLSRAHAKGAPRVLIIGLNGLAIALLVAIQANLGLTQLASRDISQVAVAEPEAAAQPAEWQDLANLYPYSKDGKPLQDILLYNQDGYPLQLPYEGYGYELERCGSKPPITNSYPLPLRRQDDSGTEPTPGPSCVPGTPMPTPKPRPSAIPMPSPSDAPTADPTPVASPPTPTPTSTPTR